MDFLLKKIEQILRYQRKWKKWQKVVASLACIVVFITTYALILPAITMDRDEAQSQGGISWEDMQEAEENVASADAQGADQDGILSAEEANLIAGSELDVSEEQAEMDVVGEENSAGEENFAGEGTLNPEAASERPAAIFDEVAGDVTVHVEAPEGAFPVGTTMKVEPVADEQVMDAVQSAVEDPVTKVSAVDIIFFDASGNEIEPAAEIKVSMSSTVMENVEQPVIVHVDEEGVGETVESEQVDGSVVFESDRFSVYVMVETETIALDYLTVSGDTYQITVDIPDGAGIPADSDLVVEEILDGTEEYNIYISQILEMFGKDEASSYLTFAHMFDIAIIHDGQKVQPQEDVKVRIELKEGQNLSDTTKVSTVHFAETGAEILAPETEGTEEQLNAVTFSTDGFSVYAVVGEGDNGDYARMTVEFYNGETKIDSMIVKNSDDATEIEKILYDPGIGEIQAGQLFKGWIMEKPNYSIEDLAEAKTIEDIREWAETKEITENDIIKFYAMLFNTYSVSFLNEEQATLHGEALIFKEGTYTNYTVNIPYTPINPEAKFDGWYWTSDTAGAVKLADGSDAPEKIQNGTEVRISGNVQFTVDAPNGHWISFVSNGEGATYTAPQFVSRNGGTSTKPNDPTRLGYRFTGWNTAADGSGETWLTVTYDNAGNPSYSDSRFETELTARQELYAQWAPVATANYSVIIWKQRVSDDKNATDANKTYDVEEVITLTGNVGSTINVVNQNGNNVNTGRGNSVRNYRVNGSEKAYTGFHAARYDQNVRIAPEGTSVLNVYYDRNLISIIFHPYTSGGTRYYIFNENTGNWSNNNVTYTGLYDAPLDFTWPTTATRTGYDYDILWHTGSNNGNLTMSFYGSYKHYIPTNVTDTMYLVDAGNKPIRFIRQKIDGTWPTNTSDTENVLTIYMSSNTFNLSEKYTGFSIKDYRTSDYTTSESGWTAARNNDGSLKSVSNYKQLNIRFTRDRYRINYFDGTYFNGNGVVLQEATKAPLDKSKEIFYEASTASYNEGGDDYFVPTAPAGYTFGGWYVDPTCTTPYTFTTMPVGGITVYAKWVQTQYRVFLHPNVPSGDPLAWGDSQQTASFRVDWGKKVAEGVTIDGERPGYDLIGWYFDEACTIPFNFDAYILNDDTVTEQYDTTDDGVYNPTANTELDKYGDVISGQEGVNKDKDNNRFWITRQLHLYAKWRSVLDGAEGIYVIYDANGGTNPPKDPLTYYLDQAQATAQGASTPPQNAEKPQQFLYWVVQRWDKDKNAYVDTNVIVYPGDTFKVLKDNARVQPITDGTETDEVYNIYTVQLRAEYGEAGTHTPTHITWYANNGTGASETDGNLRINEAVAVKPATTFKRNGYTFLGWARKIEVSNDAGVVQTIDGESPTNLDKTTYTENDLFLKWDGNKYVATINTEGYTTGDEVKKIAADEKSPYHGMVAVWEKKKYTVKIVKELPNDQKVAYQNDPFDFTASFTPAISEINESDLSFKLVGNSNGSGSVGHTKVYQAVVPYGTVVNVEEATSGFTVGVTYQYENADDSSKNGETYTGSNGGNITVEGDTTITFTNTRDTGKLKVDKHFDVQELYLDGPALAYYADHLTITITGPKQLNGDEYSKTLKLSDFTFDDTHTYTWIDQNVVTGVYHVSESGQENLIPGYELDSNSNISSTEITVTKGDTGEGAHLENQYKGKRGILSIKKSVVGVTDNEKEFKFTIKNTDLGAVSHGTPSGMYVHDEDANYFTSDPDAAFQFTIKNGQTVKKTVPEGHYVIEEQGTGEDGSAQKAGYLLSVTYSASPLTVTEGESSELTITNTYTPDVRPVAFKKVDQENPSKLLSGASFTMTGGAGGDQVTYTLTSVDTESGLFYAMKDDEQVQDLQVGTYELEETAAPSGYNSLSGKITVVVAKDGVTWTQSDNNGNAPQTAQKVGDGPYVVIITNHAGAELPHTGGSGTLPYTLGGIALIMASALMCGFRMRRRERRLN